MKKHLVILFSIGYLGLLSQEKYPVEKDTILSYYMQDKKMFRCKLIKTSANNRKCIDDKEISPNSLEFKLYYPTLESSNKVHPNKSYSYNLPYRKGHYYRVMQGYNGSYSHSGKNAIDFDMPEGTEILAIRDGLVIQVVDHNKKGCALEACTKFNNSIRIAHDDGSIANYSHLKNKGAVVKRGDRVKKGDLIGYSGNTGWSTAPHLHVECYYFPHNSSNKRETIKTLFKTGNGDRVEYLYEGESYKRNYD